MTPELKTRLITACSLLAPFLLIIAIAVTSPLGTAVLLGIGCAIVGLGANELFRLVSRDPKLQRPNPILHFWLVVITIVTALACETLAVYGESTTGVPFLGVIGICGLLFLIERESRENLQYSLVCTLPCLILLLFGYEALVQITLSKHAPWTIIWLVGVVALTDTGAYFSGKQFGGMKLCPVVSPNKTVAGAVGGIFCALIWGVTVASLIEMPFAVSGLIAVVASIAAQVGDMLKSFVKRTLDIKDFGAMFPGHGGVLDRFDGLLAAAPVLAAWLGGV